MREGMGLYKAKRIDNGEWVEGYFFAKPILEKYFIIEGENQWMVDPETIGQWTGLVDKNGVKVFEGDIVKYNFDDKWKSLVLLKEGAFGIKYRAIFLPFCDFYGADAKFEIISNIHDKAVEE